jgi:crossover junction endodeoxyribonuclease RusA
MTTITLPWPHRDLSPNRSSPGSWRKHQAATKAARKVARAICNEAGVPKGVGATLIFTYHPPGRHKRDAQNMPAMLKASIDGIADHVGCDDSAFSCLFPTGFDEIRKPGEIVVRIEVDKAGG